MKNAGEIEIVYDRSLRDRPIKIVLAIDNGGWSMEPYVEIVQTLFITQEASQGYEDLFLSQYHL